MASLPLLDLTRAEAELALELGSPVAAAHRLVEWAVERFGASLCVTASMADTVMIDLATRADPNIDVVFLDTGFHFPETLATVAAVERRYGLSVRVARPADNAPNLLQVSPDGCCAARKKLPLNEALAGSTAWLTGLRRDESPTRAGTPHLSVDERGLVKIAPLARWTTEDVESYIRHRDLIVNPLLAQGYPSIGCWPCTNRVAEGEDPRSGRWAGLAKTECGIH